MKKTFFFSFLILSLLLAGKLTAQNKPVSTQVTLITSVNNTGNEITVDADFVQMLSGNAAVVAAKRAGEAEFEINEKGDSTWYVPNDYYVANENRKIRKLVLSASVKILLVKEGTSKLTRAGIAELKKYYRDKLFRIWLADEKVVKIEEVYTP